jgi:hypothetical protein
VISIKLTVIRTLAPNIVIHPDRRVMAPARKTMARANRMMSAGPTAWSHAPQRNDAYHSRLNALSCAAVALSGGPGLMANDKPIMIVPVMPLRALRMRNHRIDITRLRLL